jgi:hypothetical protein
MEEIIMATKVIGNQPVASTLEAATGEEVTALDREVGAAFIASGIGSFALGLMVVLTELKAGAGLKSFLSWVGPVGPLSGKTGVAVIAFLASWVILHFIFKNRTPSLTRSFIVALVLIVAGVLMTFPPIFDIFATL